MNNKTDSIEFIKNRWTEYMTTGDKEKFLKNLKKVFTKLGSIDYEYCHTCPFFGMPNCHKTCGVVMKNLHRLGLVETITQFGIGRTVSIEESISNSAYAQQTLEDWDNRVITSASLITNNASENDDEENF